MRNIINYYAAIFAPISTIVLFANAKLISSNAFVLLLMIYAFIYHPYISGLRLIAANKIEKNQLLFSFIPGWNWKFFAFLFFNSND